MTAVAKAQFVKAAGRALGFDVVGITDTSPPARAAHYTHWLERGYAGTMAYLKRNAGPRVKPAEILDGARSVICVGMNYRREDGFLRAPLNSAHVREARSGEPLGLVAQYARGADYHRVLRERLERLATAIREQIDEQFRYRVCVDTAPVLERELAERAGLGWIGRNTCLLHPKLGSYLFLGELFTTLELATDAAMTDRCGSCTRCIDACPTQALAPRELDARRCIAYLTIEHRGEVAPELRQAIGQRVFGCDVCQQVCPYNAKAPLTPHEPFRKDIIGPYVRLAEWVNIGVGEHRRRCRDSAASRASASMWRRNSIIAIDNAASGADCRQAAGRAGLTGPD